MGFIELDEAFEPLEGFEGPLVICGGFVGGLLILLLLGITLDPAVRGFEVKGGLGTSSGLMR